MREKARTETWCSETHACFTSRRVAGNRTAYGANDCRAADGLRTFRRTERRLRRTPMAGARVRSLLCRASHSCFAFGPHRFHCRLMTRRRSAGAGRTSRLPPKVFLRRRGMSFSLECFRNGARARCRSLSSACRLSFTKIAFGSSPRPRAGFSLFGSA